MVFSIFFNLSSFDLYLPQKKTFPVTEIQIREKSKAMCPDAWIKIAQLVPKYAQNVATYFLLTRDFSK